MLATNSEVGVPSQAYEFQQMTKLYYVKNKFP